MKHKEIQKGRKFILKLESGDNLHSGIISFCQKEKINSGYLNIIGAIKKGTIIAGPKTDDINNIVHNKIFIKKPSEIVAFGTVFPDDKQDLILHLHGSIGHDENTITGCVQKDTIIFIVAEVVFTEILNSEIVRKVDSVTGFKLIALE
jgi:uncharacterized protein